MHFLEPAFLIAVEMCLFLLAFVFFSKSSLCDLLLVSASFSFCSFASFNHVFNLLDINDVIHVIRYEWGILH